MTFAAMENERTVMGMAEYIACRRCDSPDCNGCNLKRLETMLENGKFDCLMNENRAINTSSDVETVRHGRWILEAHDERVNYRWNVTAECSECCDEQKEIWAGFFPNVPPCIARDVALISAESVKLSNYCPNCGCRMDGGDDE